MVFASTSRNLAIVAFFIGVLVRGLDCFCMRCFLEAYPNATSEDIERAYKLDFVKQLKEKLAAMGIKPDKSNVPRLPKEIVSATFGPQPSSDQPRKEELGKIKSITLLPRSITTKNNECSFEFRLTSDPVVRRDYEIFKLKLWLPVDATGKAHQLEVHEKLYTGQLTPVLKTIVKPAKSGWQAFKIKPSKEWLTTPWKSLHLHIKGAHFSSKSAQPALHVQMRPTVRRALQKRSSPATTDDCPVQRGANQRCCKHKMSISFKDFGWIVVPQNYEALVCNGACPYMYRAIKMWTLMSQLQNKWTPCCVPTKLEPISVIVLGENNTYVRTDLPNMRVVSCGCI